ncbi:UNVERIFIED_CONTAM: hypothetical protein K2H54_065774 [Gekko kuhli]
MQSKKPCLRVKKVTICCQRDSSGPSGSTSAEPFFTHSFCLGPPEEPWPGPVLLPPPPRLTGQGELLDPGLQVQVDDLIASAQHLFERLDVALATQAAITSRADVSVMDATRGCSERRLYRTFYRANT